MNNSTMVEFCERGEQRHGLQGKRIVMRPGPGWKHLSQAVWEHASGVRVHVGGLVRLPDMTFYCYRKWPDMKEASRFIKINGGNKKRGLMAWALNLAEHNN